MDADRQAGSPRARRWLRVAEAAELLGVSQTTLRRWADAGAVPSQRTPSGQRRFQPGTLQRLAAESEGAPLPPRGARPCGNGDGAGEAGATTAALLEVARSVLHSADAESALELVARCVAEAVGAPACLVCEYDRSLDAIVSRVVHEDEPGGWDARGRVVPLAGRPKERVALRREQAVQRRGDPAASVAAAAGLERWAGSPQLLVPFGVGSGANGCFVLFGGHRARRFTDAEVKLATRYGDFAAGAIHRDQILRGRDLHASRTASLLDAGRAISSSLVLEEVLDTVARRVVAAIDARYCVIWEHVSEEDVLVERAGYEVGDSFTPLGEVIRLSERPNERRILNSPTPVLETISDPHLDPGSRASMEQWGEQTCLTVPLRIGDERLGTLVIGETERERRFTDDELELAQGLANQASVAVHNARLYRDAEARNEELDARARRERLLHELSLELSSSLDLDKVLESAARRISAILDASGCDIYALEHEDSLTCRAAFLDGEVRDEWAGRRFALADWGASRLAIAEHTTVAIAAKDDPRLGAAERALMEEWDQRAFLITPMVAHGRVLGTIEIAQSGRERVFSAEEIATLEACARMGALAVENATLYRREADHAQRLSSLLEAGRAITSSLVIGEVLETLARTAAASLGCPQALIFEYDADADTLTLRSALEAGEPAADELGLTYPVSEYPSDKVLLENDVTVVETISDPALPDDVRASMERHGEKTCLTVPLRFGGRGLGMLVLIETAAERTFTDAEREHARGLGEQAALALHNARLFENVKGLHLANLKALSAALTAKDVYTMGHTARVAAYAVLLAAELGWDPRDIQQLEEATYLHDIGKIAVSDRVLLKSGPLTDEEWALMRQHPGISAEIIEVLLDDHYVAGVRHHHERFDGGGYPDGLAGDEIPDVARLLCVVDSYDAMSSRRVYRPALSREECLSELGRCSGTQFDPVMVDAFLRVLARMEEQKRDLQFAADEAAARLSLADHLDLLENGSHEGPEYERIRATLREVRSAHPRAETMITEARLDDLRCVIMVDSDEDPDKAIAPGEVAFSCDLETETFAGRRHDANVVYIDSWGVWMAAAAPIRDGGAVVGLVSVCAAPEGMSLSGSGSAAGSAFAEILRSAAARQTRAEIESMTDELTGLSNHRRFQESLREHVDAALSDDAGLALLFCDIDNFKALNDRRGHLVGDDVLRRVAQVLSSSIRRGDVAARYGGDEFVVLLAGAGADQAAEVAERIRERVAGLEVGSEAEHPTISIGSATLPGDSFGRGDLLAKADRAMYAAKERGRDRVVAAGMLELPTFDLPASPSCDADFVGPLPASVRPRPR
jgi:diguanylate cyclase (GGDEF)-like protein/excisionase family DNA binding protein